MRRVRFKSRPEFWKKEVNGTKPNTVRELTGMDADRKEALNDFYPSNEKGVILELENFVTGEVQAFRVVDVSYWDSLVIISYDVNERFPVKAEVRN